MPKKKKGGSKLNKKDEASETKPAEETGFRSHKKDMLIASEAEEWMNGTDQEEEKAIQGNRADQGLVPQKEIDSGNALDGAKDTQADPPPTSHSNGTTPQNSSDPTSSTKDVDSSTHYIIDPINADPNVKDEHREPAVPVQVEGSELPAESTVDVTATTNDTPAKGNHKEICSHDTNGDAAITEEEISWTLSKIFSSREIKRKNATTCETAECNLKAAVCYANTRDPNDTWNSCLDCQEVDFGGWPDLEEIPLHTFSKEQVETFRNLCSTKGMDLALPLVGSSIELQNQDELEGTEETAGEWEIDKVLSSSQITGEHPVICHTEGCRLKAAVVYVSTNDRNNKWYYCLDCQESDFGGWPAPEEIPLKSLAAEMVNLLRKHCSKDPSAPMPDLPTTTSMLTSPAPSASKNLDSSHIVTPLVTEIEANMPKKSASKAALDMHKKWQFEAEKIGGLGARIVVEKNKAKKLIFDLLLDAFAPMNITQIHAALKAVVPPPVLKSSLEDMSFDADKDNVLFVDSDQEEEEVTPKKKSESANSTTDAYAASLVTKSGRNANTTLYYVDHKKQSNQGNGLSATDKNALYTALAQVDLEKQSITSRIAEKRSLTTKLLGEPTNENLTGLLDLTQQGLEELRRKIEQARHFQVNTSRKDQIKRRIGYMSAEWRKRRRICLDFLTSMEDLTEGTICRSKCLAGSGAIEIESDEAVAKNALALAKNNKTGRFCSNNVRKTTSLADNNFVAVRLNSQGCVERVYAE